ncbi:unnamed protein product, partial [Nesidiocoris tenuis]
MIVDKFVIGMNKGPVRDRLYEEDATKMKIQDAVRIAVNKESAGAQYSLSHAEPKIKRESIGFIRQKSSQRKPAQKKSAQQSSPKSSQLKCTACGGAHESHDCKFKAYTCKQCLKIGHLRNVCPSSKPGNQQFCRGDGKRPKEKMHQLAEDLADDFEVLYRLEASEDGEEFTLPLLLN